MRKLLTAAAISFACPFVPAQIIVDPTGAGTFTDLQTALNAVPPGSVITVRGGVWYGIRITKSVTIVGDPAPHFGLYLFPATTQPAFNIELAGSGNDVLTLHNVITDGEVDCFWGVPRAALGGQGFAEVRILHSSLVAPRLASHCEDAVPGIPGISLANAGSLLITVVDSTVAAEVAYAAFDNIFVPPPDGAAGIEAPLADVLVLDSTVTGGRVAAATLVAGPCPARTGRGGDGIVANRVFVADSSVNGGGGAVIYERVSGAVQCRMPDGAPFRATLVFPYAAGTRPAMSLRIGQPWGITFLPAQGARLLFLGQPRRTPFAPHPFDWFFLTGAGLLALPVDANATSFGFPVPNVTLLVGVPLMAQMLRSDLRLDRPVLDVVGW